MLAEYQPCQKLKPEILSGDPSSENQVNLLNLVCWFYADCEQIKRNLI